MKTLKDYEVLVRYPSEWYTATLHRTLIQSLIELRGVYGSDTIKSVLDEMDLFDSGRKTLDEFKKMKENELEYWRSVGWRERG